MFKHINFFFSNWWYLLFRLHSPTNTFKNRQMLSGKNDQQKTENAGNSGFRDEPQERDAFDDDSDLPFWATEER